MKVSVVTPSFQQGEFIGRTLASVAGQDVAIEHRVVDGGSTDATLHVLRAHGDRVAWTSGPDAGQADAVNRGIAATRGEILGWLNSDDVYYPDAVKRALAVFAARPEVDVVYGQADHIDADDRVIEPYPTEPWSFARLTQRCIVCQPAAFFRRAALERHGMLDASLRYCMDYELWIRMAQGGAVFAYLPRKLAGSRLHAATKTLSARVGVHAEINAMLARRLGRVPLRWLINYGYAVAESEGRRGLALRWHAWRHAVAGARRRRRSQTGQPD